MSLSWVFGGRLRQSPYLFVAVCSVWQHSESRIPPLLQAPKFYLSESLRFDLVHARQTLYHCLHPQSVSVILDS